MRTHAVLRVGRIVPLVICLLAAPLCGLGPVHAATNELIVSPTGSGSVCSRLAPCSLYRALGIADDNGLDDVITMLPGIYRDEEYILRENRALTIRGEPGTPPTDVIIDAEGSPHAFRIEAFSQSAAVAMRGFTLQGAHETGLEIQCDSGMLTIELERMIVQGNSTTRDGGGIEIESSPGAVANGNATVYATIRDSIIRYNQANRRGGGIKAASGYGGSTIHLELVNTLIYGNRANVTGGGIDLSANELGENNLVEAIILHSTITGNVADADNSNSSTGGGIRARAYSGLNANVNVYLYNSIVHGNADGTGARQDVELAEWGGEWGRGSTVMQARHSDVGVVLLDFSDGTPDYIPMNSISADPLFRNPAGSDYRLQFASPCLDRGTTVVPIDYPPGDLNGQPRVSGPGPDMGAYEYQVLPIHLPLALGG